MASYQVTSPLVIAHTDRGVFVHVYKGGLLPDDVNQKQLEQLLEQEMVTKAGTSPAPADADPDDDDTKPGGNASLEEWQDYARSQGMSDADLENKSRNELRDLYV